MNTKRSLIVLSSLIATVSSSSFLCANPDIWNVNDIPFIGQVNEHGRPVITDGLLSLNASPEFRSFDVQIHHMPGGLTSRFEISQLNQSAIIPVNRDKYAWNMPNGKAQIFDREDVDAGLGRYNSSGWRLNKVGEGAFVVESEDGWKYSYTDNVLVKAEAPTSRFLEFAYDDNAKLTDIVQKDPSYPDKVTEVLSVSYEEGKAVKLVSGTNHAELMYDRFGKVVAWSRNGTEPVRIYYNKDNRLSQIILPDGSRREFKEWDRERLVKDDFLTYGYGDEGHVWAVDHLGRKEEAYVKSQHEIVRIGADGKQVIYSYQRKPGGYGKLQTVKTKDGETLVNLSYNKSHLPTLVEERGKLPISYSYDNQDRLVEVTQGGGTVASYSYEGSNQKPVVIKNALGEATQISYDSKGNPLTITLADGSMQGYTYDAMGRVTEVILPEGYVAVNQYDDHGRLIKTVAPDGKTLEQGYTDEGALAWSSDGVNKWSYDYDNALRITGLTRNGSNWGQINYELQSDGGSLVTATDINGNKNAALYNNFGQLLHEKNQYGSTISYSYNALGQKTGFTDENGNTVSYERDKLGRVVAEINTLGQRTEYSYDKDGRLASKSTPEGKISYGYDKLDRLVSIDYGNNQKISYEYDAKWQIVKAATNEVETHYSYDKLGRIVKEMNYNKSFLKGGTEETFVSTKFSSEKNFLSGKTYTYNPRGLKASVALTDGQGNALQLTEYTYDGLARPTSISVDGQLTVAYAYDQKTMQLSSKTFADGLVQNYAYNPDGSLASIRAIKLFAKSLNQKSLSSLSHGEEIDGDMGASVLEYTFEWDAQGRLAKRTSIQSLKDSDLALSSGQSAQAMQDNESFLKGGAEETFVSTKFSSVNSAQEGFSKTELLYSYDKMGRLSSVTCPQDSTLNESYTYDATGNITQKTIAGVTSTMSYDKANRLTEMFVYEETLLKKGIPQTPDKAVAYGSVTKNVSLANNESFAEQTDIVRKNRSSFERIGDVFFQVPSEATDMSKVSKYNYQYDKAGRLSKELVNDATVASYQYGYSDKVLNVIRDRVTARFFYDAHGMVAAKTVTIFPDSSLPYSSSFEVWQYDGLALARRGNEAYINEASIVGGTTLMKRDLSFKGEDLSKETYYLNDHLGTTLASFDAQKTNAIAATSFGEPLKSSNLNFQSEKSSAFFTGKPYDSELGAYVYAYRNYRADLGRWMTSDPAGYPDGTNNYRYAATPNNGFDRLGLRGKTAIWSHYQLKPRKNDRFEDMMPYVLQFATVAWYEMTYRDEKKGGRYLNDRDVFDCKPYNNNQDLGKALVADGVKIFIACHANKIGGEANMGWNPDPIYASMQYFLVSEPFFLSSLIGSITGAGGNTDRDMKKFYYDGCYLHGRDREISLWELFSIRGNNPDDPILWEWMVPFYPGTFYEMTFDYLAE